MCLGFLSFFFFFPFYFSYFIVCRLMILKMLHKGAHSRIRRATVYFCSGYSHQSSKKLQKWCSGARGGGTSRTTIGRWYIDVLRSCSPFFPETIVGIILPWRGECCMYVCNDYVCFINRLRFFLTKWHKKCTEYRRWPGKNCQVFSPKIAKNGLVASINSWLLSMVNTGGKQLVCVRRLCWGCAKQLYALWWGHPDTPHRCIGSGPTWGGGG